MRPVVRIPTLLASLQVCRVNDGFPTCEAGVGDEFVQCGEDAPFERQDKNDAEPWPVCALHRTLPDVLL